MWPVEKGETGSWYWSQKGPRGVSLAEGLCARRRAEAPMGVGPGEPDPQRQRGRIAAGRCRKTATDLNEAGGSYGKESASSAGDLRLILGSGKSPGVGNGYTLQYSCLENSMERGTWRATVHGVVKSWTQLSD